MAASTTYTLGQLDTDVRAIANDVIQTDGQFRYTDAEVYAAINDALQQLRMRRPDAFLGMGLRNVLPLYNSATDAAVFFPLDNIYYPAVLWYVVGRLEMKEDTFADDKRAATLMQQFSMMIMSVGK